MPAFRPTTLRDILHALLRRKNAVPAPQREERRTTPEAELRARVRGSGAQ